MKKETTGIMQSYFNLNLLLSLTRMRASGALRGFIILYRRERQECLRGWAELYKLLRGVFGVQTM